jgi:ribosomal protein L16 Arg81 hydroxylase
MFFDSFLEPMKARDFFAHHWERKPLHVVRGQPARYAALFSLTDADRVLSNSCGAWSTAIRVVDDGRAVPLRVRRSGGNRAPGGLEAAYQAYRKGATLILSSLQDRWPAVRALHDELAAALGGPVNVNAYLTPPNSAGFSMHYDTHDVFVLQTAGSKKWRIRHPPVVLPLKTQAFTKEKVIASPDQASDPHPEVVLAQGDLLYIPRGFLHAAQSGDSASLHLTVGVFPPLLGPTLVSAVQAAVEQNPALRAALPVGFGRDDQVRAWTAEALAKLSRAAIDHIDWEKVLDDAAATARLHRKPDLDGHLLDLDSLAELRPDTLVHKRDGCDWLVRRAGGRLRVSFYGKHLLMPLHVEDEMRFIENAGTFAAADIPGPLDESSKLVLVRRLMLEGALARACPLG